MGDFCESISPAQVRIKVTAGDWRGSDRLMWISRRCLHPDWSLHRSMHAVTSGDSDQATDEDQAEPVSGDTGEALPEPCRVTSSRLPVHVSDQTVRNRCREDPTSFPGTCAHSTALCCLIGILQRTPSLTVPPPLPVLHT